MEISRPFTLKYRPRTLDDFQMNDDLRNVLYTFIRLEKLNILLVGNSGSGKTSLIHAIINHYYGFDVPNSCENILSINTLKEQGISYYRNEVRVFCQTSSVIPGKKKVLLLDDIDMINEQSQQVFRNCIDKYSHNVTFIASCCNSQKVIDSLQSRMDIVKIFPYGKNELTCIANTISQLEGIIMNDDVVNFITTVCNGSVRILVNYLEKFKLVDMEISIDLASELCTNISFKELANYNESCKSGNLRSAICVMNSLIDKGYSVTDVLDNYFTFVKNTDLLNEEEKYKIIPLICKYITIFHNLHEDEIELIFFTNNIVDAIRSLKNIY
jgi:replication factor C subunit 2/4